MLELRISVRKVFKKMKAFIIYDSIYGNTDKIAQAIRNGLTGEVKVVRVGEVNPNELKTCDLLILGSPVHRGSDTHAVDAFIQKFLSTSIHGTRVHGFATRIK